MKKKKILHLHLHFYPKAEEQKLIKINYIF